MASSSSVYLPSRRKSSDTLYSADSNCVFHKRKLPHPLTNSVRPYVSRSSNSNVTQRVLSARLLKLRSLQSQLNDANAHLAEFQQENRALRNLQTRQDKALSKYEGTNADLPKLLKCHEEEIRVLVTKNKTLKKNLKDAVEQSKAKDEEINNLREQLKALTLLTKNKNLAERHVLLEKIEDFKEQLKTSEEKLNMANRKLTLESKNTKHKLNSEMSKAKDVQKDLSYALQEIERLNGLLEVKGKFPVNTRKRFASLNQKQSISLISLTSNTAANKESNVHTTNEEIFNKRENIIDSVDEIESSGSDIKLDACINNHKEIKVTFTSDVMTCPSENIKARLSASSHNEDKDVKSIRKPTVIENGLPTARDFPTDQLSRSNSAHKLKKLTTNILNKDKKDSIQDEHKKDNIQDMYKKDNTPQDMPKKDNIQDMLSSYCKEVTSVVKSNCSVVDQLNTDLQNSKSDTEKLLLSLREADSANSKLRYSNFLVQEKIEIPEKDIDLANQIWTEEFAFKKCLSSDAELLKRNQLSVRSDVQESANKQEVKAAIENKNKLLETLRAIDRGDEFDSADTVNSHKRHSKVI